MEALAAMGEQAAEAEAPETGATETETPEKPVNKEISPEQIAGAIATAIAMVGGVMTQRFHVAPLTPDEIGQLTVAGAEVAALYNIQANPYVIAWAGLGYAAYTVVTPRMEEYKANKEAAMVDVTPSPDTDQADNTPEHRKLRGSRNAKPAKA